MSSLFYSKISRVSRVRAITDMGTGDEKRIGEVPTLFIFIITENFIHSNYVARYICNCNRDFRAY